MKSFIESQFSYCPLIWMFHSRTLNNRINKLHERGLRLVYKDPQLTFVELLRKDKSVTIHHRNLQKLATEMYEAYNDLSPSLMQSVSPQRSISYDLRKKIHLNQQMSTQSIMEPKQYLTGVQKFVHWFQKILSALNP